MLNTKLVEAAQALQNACDDFIVLHGGKTPRVQFREMATVFAAFRALVLITDAGKPVFVPIGSFGIDRNGQRTKERADTVALKHIAYNLEGDYLESYVTTIPLRAEDGSYVILKPIDGTRVTSAEEVVEMGYSLDECARHMRKMAERISLDAYTKAAGGQVGLA